MARDLPLPVATILYVYYVRPVLEYASPVLEYASPVWHGSLREEDAMSLERIQASVARGLLQADWFTPKEELFRKLGWPALRWRREITSLTMFHKLLHSHPRNHSAKVCSSMQVPPQLAAAASHSNCSSYTHIPHARENLFFFYRSALLWNSLPHNRQLLENSKSFCDALENDYQSYKYTTTKKNFHIPPSSAFS